MYQNLKANLKLEKYSYNLWRLKSLIEKNLKNEELKNSSKNLLEYHVTWAEEDLKNLKKNLGGAPNESYHFTYENKFEFMRYFDEPDNKWNDIFLRAWHSG